MPIEELLIFWKYPVDVVSGHSLVSFGVCAVRVGVASRSRVGVGSGGVGVGSSSGVGVASRSGVGVGSSGVAVRVGASRVGWRSLVATVGIRSWK